MRPHFIIYAALTALSLGWASPLRAQYFGRNKPIYKDIRFRVYATPHFDIYHYLGNDSVLNRLAQASERWHNRHSRMFGDTLSRQNPILAYSNHADFQQTNAISGTVGVGTGGVTESLKNRVIFPLTETWAQTNHVLGHEMVHAFQYDMLLGHDSLSVNSIQQVPLWMVEGMAEYLSIGSTDNQTAMWIRDALLNDNFPTLRQLTTQMHTYFPYRWGHAFWAFVGKTFGDSLIVPIFRETALSDYGTALHKHLGMDEEALSVLWRSVCEEHYMGMMPHRNENPPGSKILFERNAGEANISPSVSPDGRHVAFFSEMDLFSTDLFIAHAVSGKVLRRLSQQVRKSDVDAINFVESAGTWSPDSRRFAFVAFSRGVNKLIIIDLYTNEQQELAIEGVPYFNHPAWSPDGQSIAVSGLVDGINDLYSIDLRTLRTTQLTRDPWCNIHPAWSANGEQIVFSTDHPTPLNPSGMGYSLATLDVASGQTRTLDVFPTAENLNPMFSGCSTHIYFLSNREGFRNLYRHTPSTGRTVQLTDLLTGISGISPLAPAMSVARENDEICYSHFYNGRYSIYSADTVELHPVEVSPLDVNIAASTLPPSNRAVVGIVDAGLSGNDSASHSSQTFRHIPFKRKFKLDYVSNIGMGMTAGQFGTGLAGGIEMLFSDITGTNMLYAALALNGEIYDFGGQLSYVKQRRYMAWGATLAHIPISWGAYGFDTLTAQIDGQKLLLDDYQLVQYRLFQSSAGLMVQFPLSTTQRFELSAAVQRYSYRIDIYSNYYHGNIYYGSDRHRDTDAPAPIWMQRTTAAYVFDNSDFGMASPMRGQRAWIGAEKAFGDYDYVALGADLRRYIFRRPLCFAMRAMYKGRFGRSELLNLLSPIYLAYPWYVRGYSGSQFNRYDPSGITNIDQMQGNQMVLLSAELRIPFTGPARLALIGTNKLFTELALFTDAGMAWSADGPPTMAWHPSSREQHIPFVSSGISLRVNLFGMIVLEPYLAVPYQLGGLKSLNFGLNFLPGW
ncbi:MAG: PD40 domain-containing protein [Bacteroidales bacterium]|nr:PD40 domain-containing protein [Bacteroidales bacterium]